MKVLAVKSELLTCQALKSKFQVGLQELFSFKQKNPHVDLEPFLAQSSQYFRLLFLQISSFTHIKPFLNSKTKW